MWTVGIEELLLSDGFQLSMTADVTMTRFRNVQQASCRLPEHLLFPKVKLLLNISLKDVACVLPRWQVMQREPEAWGIVRHCEHAAVYPFLTACLFHFRLARIVSTPAKMGLTLREHHCSTPRIVDVQRSCRNVGHKRLELAPMCLLEG